MAISLNDHETRIKALENASSQLGTPNITASNTFGTCLEFGKLIIQGGKFSNGGAFNRDITFPKVFPSKVTQLVCCNQAGPSSTYDTKGWYMRDTNYGIDGKPNTIWWIAIGY